jgi:hypothetical protein
VLIWLVHRATHVAQCMDRLWDPSGVGVHIYRAIHYTIGYMTKSHIMICAIAYDLNQARKC